MILRCFLLCFLGSFAASQQTIDSLLDEIFGIEKANNNDTVNLRNSRKGVGIPIETVKINKSQQSVDLLLDEIFGKEKANNSHNVRPSNNSQDVGNPNKTVEIIDGDCTCISYYLCPNGGILTDDTGILDISGTDLEVKCENYLDVCCNNSVIKPTAKTRKGCGQRHPEGVGFRIQEDNNNETQFGEFPWMVALLKRSILDDGSDLSVYQCGGALIHENVVLTAAHCVNKKSQESSELYIRAGEWDTQTANEIYPHQDRKVVRMVTHPEFQSGNLWNDFALLVLDRPVTLQEHVDTVCLPLSGDILLKTECYSTGWGKDNFGRMGHYPAILKKFISSTVPKNQCTQLLQKSILGNNFELHDSFMCAGVGKDRCNVGDGGSPLVCPVAGKPGTYELTGLLTWGFGCVSETPTVYADVSYAHNWINKTMADIGFFLEE